MTETDDHLAALREPTSQDDRSEVDPDAKSHGDDVLSEVFGATVDTSPRMLHRMLAGISPSPPTIGRFARFHPGHDCRIPIRK